MAKKHDNVVTDVPADMATGPIVEPEDGTLGLASIVMEGDEFFVVDIATGEKQGPCKYCDEGDKTIVLPKNASNRKWFNRKKAQEECEKNGSCELPYKASRHIGSGSNKVPNSKMVEWYRDNVEGGQALYDEYMAIINEAIAARDAAKAKPMTELEKAQAKLKKAQESYAKLLAQAAGNNASADAE